VFSSAVVFSGVSMSIFYNMRGEAPKNFTLCGLLSLQVLYNVDTRLYRQRSDINGEIHWNTSDESAREEGPRVLCRGMLQQQCQCVTFVLLNEEWRKSELAIQCAEISM